MAELTVDALTVTKGGTRVLDGVDLHVDDGTLTAVVGRSGSGKTSLLRAVAGLEPVASGEVLLGGEPITHLEPQRRQVAMVFQEAVLYPFLTARGNVAFPLEIEHRPAEEVATRVSAEGRAMGIEELLDVSPGRLSAGHRQLVQIARAMVRAPRVLLLDEPLANVDSPARASLRTELRTLQRGYGVTAVHVTNDPVEAMAMGDRMAVMASGRVVQAGTPAEVYAEPSSREVAEVTGEVGLWDAEVELDPPGFLLVAGRVRLRAWARALTERVGGSVVAAVRPEDVLVGPAAGEGDGPFTALVTEVQPVGHHDRVAVDLGGFTLGARTAPGAVRRGDGVPVTLRRPLLFDRRTGDRIR